MLTIYGTLSSKKAESRHKHPQPFTAVERMQGYKECPASVHKYLAQKPDILLHL